MGSVSFRALSPGGYIVAYQDVRQEIVRNISQLLTMDLGNHELHYARGSNV